MRLQVSAKLYKVLGLNDYAEIKEIRKAYRKLCLKNHPDRKGGNLDRMKRINAAYDFLLRYKTDYDYHLSVFNNKKAVRRHIMPQTGRTNKDMKKFFKKEWEENFEGQNPFYNNGTAGSTGTSNTGGYSWTFKF